MGINSPICLSQVEVLTVLGRGLQKLYDSVLEQGVPEYLDLVVEKLDQAQG